MVDGGCWAGEGLVVDMIDLLEVSAPLSLIVHLAL